MIDGDKIKTRFSKNIKVLRNKSNWEAKHDARKTWPICLSVSL